MTIALVMFSPSNGHPYAWLLNKKHRHVWVSVQDIDRCTWVSYDWRQGNPLIQFDAVADYDLEAYWRSFGITVVRVDTGNALPWGPWMLNNCVGHSKLILGARTWAVTPHGLWRHLTGNTYRSRIMNWLRCLTLVPGGGGAPASPPQAAPRGYQFVTKKSGQFTGTDPNSDTGGSIQLTKAQFDAATAQQAAHPLQAGDGDEGPGRSRPNDYFVTEGMDQTVNSKYVSGGRNNFNLDLGSFTEGTKRTLELIPGFTQAGPDTAPGFTNGPAGSGGDAPPAPPPTPSEVSARKRSPQPKLTPSQAKRPATGKVSTAQAKKSATGKVSTAQGGGGTGGGGAGSSGTGDLSDARTTSRNLLG